MDITEALQTGYFQALVPLGLQVYTSYAVPENVEYPYVLISTISNNQRNVDRPCIQYEAFITLDIVTGFIHPIGRKQALDISYSIEQVVNPDDGTAFSIPAPWTNTGSWLQNNGTLESKAKNYYIYRVVKTYRHLISKNNG